MSKSLNLLKVDISVAGFTLMEMLVAIVISGLLMGLALPRLVSLDDSFNRMNAKSYLVQDLKRAQAESITQGCRGIFQIAPGGNSYSFGCDYLSYDTNDPPASDVISFQRSLPTNISLSTSGPIVFNSRGQAIDLSYDMTNLTVSLSDTSSGASVQFVSGTLLGTGVFSYN